VPQEPALGPIARPSMARLKLSGKPGAAAWCSRGPSWSRRRTEQSSPGACCSIRRQRIARESSREVLRHKSAKTARSMASRASATSADDRPEFSISRMDQTSDWDFDNDILQDGQSDARKEYPEAAQQ